jgi:hypothetical protein
MLPKLLISNTLIYIITWEYLPSRDITPSDNRDRSSAECRTVATIAYNPVEIYLEDRRSLHRTDSSSLRPKV